MHSSHLNVKYCFWCIQSLASPIKGFQVTGVRKDLCLRPLGTAYQNSCIKVASYVQLSPDSFCVVFLKKYTADADEWSTTQKESLLFCSVLSIYFAQWSCIVGKGWDAKELTYNACSNSGINITRRSGMQNRTEWTSGTEKELKRKSHSFLVPLQLAWPSNGSSPKSLV